MSLVRRSGWLPEEVEVFDSHTSGEPTRVVLKGGPPLQGESLAEEAAQFRDEFVPFRRAILGEPRGGEHLVGALLREPRDPDCVAGVIFFNNVGLLGMCGHGMIGLVVTLVELGRFPDGPQQIETPVGNVQCAYLGEQRVEVRNVPSYRYRRQVVCPVPGLGPVQGDIAWGGNWFFLVEASSVGAPEICVAQAEPLKQLCLQIRAALRAQGITGANGAEIDHMELTGPPVDPENHGRNFVLCPGGEYDRSPCGTGTSAKLACLLDEGKLQPGVEWRQESINGGVFCARGTRSGDHILPTLTGTAYPTARSTLLFSPQDPLLP